MDTDGRLPDFLVIGAPRSGTTTLHRYLDAHPQVFMAPQKEVHFFDRHHTRGVDWYRRQFAGATPDQTVGEASPTYLADPDARSRMAALVPDAKLVCVLRNPVDRAYSNYWYLLRGMGAIPGEHAPTFRELVRAELHPTAPVSDVARAWTERQSVLDVGRYAAQLRALTDLYPRKAVLVLLLEDLRTDPGTAYGSVCRHIGVDDTVLPQEVGGTFNRASRARFPTLRRLMLRAKLWRRLPSGLAHALDRWNEQPEPYPPMDPDLRRELLTLYREDNIVLADWLDRDLSMWSR